MKNYLFSLLFIFLPLGAHARWMQLQNEGQIEAEKQVIQSAYEPIKTCWGWGCNRSKEVVLNESEWGQIDALFKPQASTPREERKQVRLAIGKMEKILGELNGETKYDLGAPNSKGQGKSGQTDCVDESTNTTRYLKFLIARGLIRLHRIDDIEMRLNKVWMPFLGQHFTATIKDLKSGKRYAVDSWWYDNGTPAVIQDYDAWSSRKSFDPNYVP